jgi:hypothetical protein
LPELIALSNRDMDFSSVCSGDSVKLDGEAFFVVGWTNPKELLSATVNDLGPRVLFDTFVPGGNEEFTASE